MAVALQAISESHTGATGSASEASFTWEHGVSGTPEGLVIFVWADSATNPVTSVTAEGTNVPAVSGGEAVDSAGEPGNMKAFFLGSGLAGLPLTIVVNRTNNATEMWACAITVSTDGGANSEAVGVVLVQADGTLVEQNVDDGSPGTNSLRLAGGHSGLAAVPAAGTNSTAVHGFDTGNFVAWAVRETTAGQGSRPVGAASGTSDDRAAVYLAVKEAGATTHEGAAVLSATAAVSPTGQMTANAVAALAASAAVTASGSLEVRGAAVLNASAAVAADGQLTHGGQAALAATATLDATAQAEHRADAALPASATLSPAATVEANAAANLAAVGSVAAAGSVELHGDVLLGATAIVGADPQITRTAQSALDAAATVAADGTVQTGAVLGEAVLAAAATLGPTGQLTAQAVVTITASAELSAAGLIERLAIALLASDAQLAASGLLQVNAAVQLAASASLSADGQALLQAAAALLASAALGADGTVAGAAPPPPDYGSPITRATLGRAGRRPPFSWEREAGFGPRIVVDD